MTSNNDKEAQITKEFIEKFMKYDQYHPHESADYMEDNTTKHNYFYRPFVDGNEEYPDGDKYWKPQVVPLDMQQGSAIPTKILKQFIQSKYMSTMGLFTEIHRAWIIADRVDDRDHKDGNRMDQEDIQHNIPIDAGNVIPPNNEKRVYDLLLWDYENENNNRGGGKNRNNNTVLSSSSSSSLSSSSAMDTQDGEISLGEELYGTPAVTPILDFSQPITAVGIVTPRDGRVRPDPDTLNAYKYILVVATVTKIYLYGMEFANNSIHNRLVIAEFDDFVPIPTDGVIFHRIMGTATGRIFLGGSDGCVHELCLPDIYELQASSKGITGAITDMGLNVLGGVGSVLGIPGVEMLAKRARRLNKNVPLAMVIMKSLLGSIPTGGHRIIDMVVDHERNLFYTLALDGRITVYQLGPSGEDFTMAGRIEDMDAAAEQYCTTESGTNTPEGKLFVKDSAKKYLKSIGVEQGVGGLENILQNGKIANTNGMTMAWPMETIQVIPVRESRRVHLVATARSGARFYFTTYAATRYKQLKPGSTVGSFTSTASNVNQVGSSPGATLSLVYIRLPPPFAAQKDYVKNDTKTVEEMNKSEDKWFIPGTQRTLEPVTMSIGGGALTLMVSHLDSAKEDNKEENKETNKDKPEHIIAMSRDYLERIRDRRSLRYGEDVADVPLGGIVYGIGEVLSEPNPTLDIVFAPSGAIILPNGETSPLPCRAFDIRRGAGISMDTLGPVTNAAVIANKRSRDDSNITDGTLVTQGQVVRQEPFNDSNILPQYQHLVRRRIWDMASGWGDVYSDWSTQHDPRASARSFVVLTNMGVLRLTRTRPIDQLAYILKDTRINSVVNKSNGNNAVNVPSPIPNSLIRFINLLPQEEVLSLIVAIGCHSMREQDLPMWHGRSRPAHDTLITLRPGATMGPGADENILYSNARAAFNAVGGAPRWRTDVVLTYSSKDLLFSMKVAGILLYLSRVLRPIWNTTCFIKTPAKIIAPGGLFVGETLGNHGVINIGARRQKYKNEFAKTQVEDKILLPRYTREECRELKQRLQHLAEFITSSSTIVDGMYTNPAIYKYVVKAAGMGKDLGYTEDDMDKPPPLPSDPDGQRSALDARAAFMENLFLYFMLKLIKRASEAVSVMSAIAETSYGAMNILARCAEGKSGSTAKVSFVTSDADVLSIAGSITWEELIMDEKKGPKLTESLFSRMLHNLRERGLQARELSRSNVAGNLSMVTNLSTTANTQADLGIDKVLERDAAARFAAELAKECPLFFSEGSRLLVEAHAAADSSILSNINAQRKELLEKSLAKALAAVNKWKANDLLVQMDDLERLCLKYRNASYYAGVIELMLAIACQAAGGADKLDKPPIDADEPKQISPGTNVRRRAYKMILDTLQLIRNENKDTIIGLSASNVSANVGTVGGNNSLFGSMLFDSTLMSGKGSNLKLSLLGSTALGSSVPSSTFIAFLDQVLRSKDAYFHDTLYTWLRTNSMGGFLRGISTPYIEVYLRRRTGKDAQSLLYTYLVANKQYTEAAQEAFRMATEIDAELTNNIILDERIKYLEMAISMARESSVQLSGSIPVSEVAKWEDFHSILKVQSSLLHRMVDIPKQLRPISTVEADKIEKKVLQLTYETLNLDRLYKIVSEGGVSIAENKVVQTEGLYDLMIEVLAIGVPTPQSEEKIKECYLRLLTNVIEAGESRSIQNLVFVSPGVYVDIKNMETHRNANQEDIPYLIELVSTTIHYMSRLYKDNNLIGFPLNVLVYTLEVGLALGLGGNGLPFWDSRGHGWLDKYEQGNGDNDVWDYGWLINKALQDIPFEVRFQVYYGIIDQHLRAYQSSGTTPNQECIRILIHFLRTWCVFIKDWQNQCKRTGRERQTFVSLIPTMYSLTNSFWETIKTIQPHKITVLSEVHNKDLAKFHQEEEKTATDIRLIKVEKELKEIIETLQETQENADTASSLGRSGYGFQSSNLRNSLRRF